MQLARTHGAMKERAMALRLDQDMSIHQIAEHLDLPKSTVGQWVRGHGETNILRECPMCRHSFFAGRKDKVFCRHACRTKYRDVFGGWRSRQAVANAGA